MSIFPTWKKNRKSEVLVFAFPRTGSTTLAESLAMFTKVTTLLEPFNETHGDARDRDVNNRDSLYSVLNEISDNGINVVKHLSCQLSQELNTNLLEYGFRQILFLWRRNALKRAVSHAISSQAGHWRRDREKILNTEYKPLDIDNLSRNMEWYRSEVKWYREFMRSEGIPCTEIVMEDFYQNSMEEKERFVVKLARHCFPLRGLRYNQSALRELLSPEVSKLNSRETYRLIPNIDEVDQELSNEENGYLFK